MGSSINNNNIEKVPAEKNETTAIVTVPRNETSDDTEDPVELMLKKTGCLEKHYGVQECIAETRDWRQCQKQVSDFRACMVEHQKRTKLEQHKN